MSSPDIEPQGRGDDRADLAISLSAAPSGVAGHFELQVSVTNHGPDDARGVLVAAGNPSGFTFVLSHCSEGEPRSSSSPVVRGCRIGRLERGETAVLGLVARLHPGVTTASLDAEAYAKTFDPDTSNNGHHYLLRFHQPQGQDQTGSLFVSQEEVPDERPGQEGMGPASEPEEGFGGGEEEAQPLWQ